MYVIPFLPFMLLGTSYNYNKAAGGIDVFSRSQVEDNTQVIQRAFTKSEFKMIRSQSDVKDILDINGELSLKVMADLVNVEGSGKYLKQTQDRSNAVEIVCRLVYETETETLLSEASPMAGWENNLGESTHFVRSIMYGGELVASVKFMSTEAKSLEDIEAALTASVGIEGTLDVSVGGKLKKLAEDNSNDVSLSINYYATTRVEGVPQDIEGLQELIANFPTHVQRINNGKGNPLRVELYPLASLQQGSNVAKYVRNAAISGRLNEIRDKFLDIRTATKETGAWFSSLGTEVSMEALLKVSDLKNQLEAVEEAFRLAIIDMDISQEGDPAQFDAALEAYRQGGDNIPGKYFRHYKAVRVEVEELLNQDCYGNPIHNAGLPRGNLIGLGEAIQLTDPQSLETCKSACDTRKNAGQVCVSVTYTREAGVSEKEVSASSQCWINLVPISQNTLIPVPHLVHKQIYIYVRDETC